MEENNKLIDDFTEDDKVEGNQFHDFKIQPVVIGVLYGFDEGKHGKHPLISLGNDEVIAIGDYTALKDRFGTEDIGKKVKIVFKGEEKSKTGRMYMAFDVYLKEIK